MPKTKELCELFVPFGCLDKEREDIPERQGPCLEYIDTISQIHVMRQKNLPHCLTNNKTTP